MKIIISLLKNNDDFIIFEMENFIIYGIRKKWLKKYFLFFDIIE